MSNLTEVKPTTKYQARNVLIETTLHKLLVLFQNPVNWPTWKVALAWLLLMLSVGSVWFVVVGEPAVALMAFVTLALFSAADAVLLRSLPARGVSYGPWQSQLFFLAIPRAVFASLLSPVAALAGTGWGLVALLLTQIIGSAALVWGALIEPFRLQLTELNLKTDRLPADSAPIRVLHISDLHVERLTRREEKLLQLVEHAQADMILITGDYLNLSYVRDPEAQTDVRRLLSQLAAPKGVYAVLGSPTVDERKVVPPLFEDLPIQLLIGQWETVDLGGGRALVLLGMECSHDLTVDRLRLQHLTAGAPNTFPQVLLYHAPDLMPEAAEQGIDLYLCGHTHGGQVRLPLFGALFTSSQLGKQFEMGPYQRGRTHLYVSRGVGLEGLSAPRVRFLAPPEITLVTISGRSP